MINWHFFLINPLPASLIISRRFKKHFGLIIKINKILNISGGIVKSIRINEPVNSLTHLTGALLSIAGLVLLIIKASHPVRPWLIVSFSIYGIGMLLMYTASTVYHMVGDGDSKKDILRKIDHIMIFFFIAASYTPICLVVIRGGWGWSLFGVIWIMALAGFVLKTIRCDLPRGLTALLYVLMGWTALVALYPLVTKLSTAGLFWLVMGGIFYTVGALIYSRKYPDPLPNIFGFHEIFHVFILFGSACHFWLIFRYIMTFN
jgi:hemolysin III